MLRQSVSVHNISRTESNNQRGDQLSGFIQLPGLFAVPHHAWGLFEDVCSFTCFFECVCREIFSMYTCMYFILSIPPLMRPDVVMSRRSSRGRTLTHMSVHWIHTLISACGGSDAKRHTFVLT